MKRGLGQSCGAGRGEVDALDATSRDEVLRP